MKYGDREVSAEEIIEMIPSGISVADSLALFKSLLDSWVNDVVMADFAEAHLIDTSMIDRKVAEYRNSLIIQEYLMRMRESQTPKINDEKISEYYVQHKKDIKLEVPLIKGVFVSISNDYSGREEIKNLLTSTESEAIDKFENKWGDKLSEYNYFRDNWVDWETISARIPTRIPNPDKFLEENDFFEMEDEDKTYYLQISEYMPSGNEQPYEYAKNWINNLLSQRELADYEVYLVNSLIEKAIKDHKLEAIGYDPLTHQFKQENSNEK